MDKDLEAQNNGVSWRDCESAGLKHRLGPYEEVVSAYGSEVHPVKTKVRRCTRCPVVLMYVPRGGDR